MPENLLKPVELRQMSAEQLSLTLRDAARSLFQLRFRTTSERNQIANETKALKRYIARIKTIQRERELQLAAQERTA